jgi:ParB-like chromosome segregation protein Spo0J
MRVKRKEIKKTEPIRCIIDIANDAHEISLDENVTRENMHPADQFEAFRKLAEEHGFGAEEIAARFDVTAPVVQQRLRLGAVSPKLMQVYAMANLVALCLLGPDPCGYQAQKKHRLRCHRRPSLGRKRPRRATAKDALPRTVGKTIAISGSIELKGSQTHTKVYGARPQGRAPPQWVKSRLTVTP